MVKKLPLEVFYKKAVLKLLQYSQETPVLESLFNKVAGLRPASLSKKRLWHRCFPVNFLKFLRTHFLKEHLWCVFVFDHFLGSALKGLKVKNTYFEKHMQTAASVDIFPKAGNTITRAISIDITR